MNDWQAILKILYQAVFNKTLSPEDYSTLAFNGLPISQKIQLLLEAADGKHPAETHWPLLHQVLVHLSQNTPSTTIGIDAMRDVM